MGGLRGLLQGWAMILRNSVCDGDEVENRSTSGRD